MHVHLRQSHTSAAIFPFMVTLIASIQPPISTNIQALSTPQTQLKLANVFKGYRVELSKKTKDNYIRFVSFGKPGRLPNGSE